MDWGEELLRKEFEVVSAVESTSQPIQDKSVWHPQVKHLFEVDSNIPQRSQAWFDLRRGCITASDIASVLPLDDISVKEYAEQFGIPLNSLVKPNGFCNPYSDKQNVILKKCGAGPGFTGNAATEWGTKYEPVAQDFYRKLTNSELLEFGMLVDPENTWIGASPDGITTKGCMLEIKCPLNRQLSDAPPLSYWIQQQIQLQVCKLDMSHFLDCIIVEFVSQRTWEQAMATSMEPSFRFSAVFETPQHAFVYPPWTVQSNDELIQWVNDSRKKFLSEPSLCMIFDFKLIPVPRSCVWFENNAPRLYSVWEEILSLRHAGPAALEEAVLAPPLDVKKKQTKTKANKKMETFFDL